MIYICAVWGTEWEYMKTFSMLCWQVVETPVVNVVKVSKVHTHSHRESLPAEVTASFSQTLTAFQGCSYRQKSTSVESIPHSRWALQDCRDTKTFTIPVENTSRTRVLDVGCFVFFLVKQHHQKVWCKASTISKPVQSSMV